MPFRVQIDRDECIQCGACYASCPEVFEENADDGLSQVVTQYRAVADGSEGEIPDDLEDCAQEAADGCPVEIIHVTEV